MVLPSKGHVNDRARRGLGSRDAATAVRSLSELARKCDGQIRIACDTEFQGPHTLTAQFAARLGGAVAVQVYRSPAVPEPPDGFDPNTFLPEGLRSCCEELIFRPVKSLTSKLSPVRVVADLFGLKMVRAVPRGVGAGQPESEDGAETLTLVLVAHHWAADLFRVFGADYWKGLLGQGTRLEVRPHKPLGFQERSAGGRFRAPVLEYAQEGAAVYPVRVQHFDTNLPFGSSTLEEHARTFLGVGKAEGISHADKSHMLKTFKRKTREAYGYAVLDAVLTLFIEDRMREADVAMYRALGFPEGEAPPLRPTLGGRVAVLITRSVARAAAGSAELARKDRPDTAGQAPPASQGKVKELLHGGSGAFLAEEARSRFGRQTGETHGGLLFSRTSTRLFHAGPGQFRDIDLSGCYAAIIASMNLYVGRPVVWEPGSRRVTVKEAVAGLKEHAAGNDAWLIKASGAVSGMPNVLIPSTDTALTHANYQKRAAKQRARSRWLGRPFDWLYEGAKDAGNAALYSDVIEAGMVTWPTWLMIQALPEKVKQAYENLEVETVLFYPAKLVAESGREFDKVVARHRRDGPPWSGTLDLDRMEQVIVERLGDEHVSLRFRLDELAQKMIQLRREARQASGQGSGAELAWKQAANTMYGVLASPHLTTNNVVAANYITATGRALAFAMQLGLNGFQVITDGCTYRRDEIPACTLADCLKTSPEYPLRRPEGKVPFLDPSAIPEGDAAFTAWYRGHVKKFLGVKGLE